MYFFIRNSCIRIPLVFEKEHWFQSIVSDLTRDGRDYNNPKMIIKIKYYDVRHGHLLIPRNYPVEKFGHRVLTYLSDGKDIDISFKSKLRDNSDLQKNGHDFLSTDQSGVLCMQPGEGKTVVTISAICAIKKKAIIYVHKDSLATQWKERFLQHSTINENDIGFLKTSNCEEVLRKPIVISTVQTLCSMVKRLDNIEQLLCDADFGISVWDECHTSVSAETFSLSSLYTPTKRSFGLSATPSRSDGNTDIIEKHIGKTFIPDGSGSTMEPKVVVLKFDHGAVRNHRKYIFTDYTTGKSGFDRSRYYKMLTSKNNNSYSTVMQKVCKQVYQAGRTSLFISDRIKILDVCSASIPKSDVGFFIPRSAENRDSDLQKRFVFSTYGSARDGTDRPEFDCLIMSTPTSNLEQCTGRVVRTNPNKQQPIIFDIVDTGCSQMEDLLNYRMEFYKKKGWQVELKKIK